MDLAPYIAAKGATVAQLKCDEAFAALETKEARYAAALYNAAWAGFKITLLQTSPESPPVFELLRLVFSSGVHALSAAAVAAGVSQDDVECFLAFSASFFENAGNYRSFGDTKIIPGIPPAAFAAIVHVSPAYAAGSAETRALVDELWAAAAAALWDATPRLLQLGMGPTKGITTYYSAGFTEEDAALVSRFVAARGLEQPYNTRVFKAGPGRFQIRLASALTSPPAGGSGTAPLYDSAAHLLLGSHAFEGASIEVVRGDYAPLLARVIGHLTAAQGHAANEAQAAALARYVDSFRTGSALAHIDGSRHWVADKGPAVESYIGFIETYRDPMGVRGEWEAFVAVVNKPMSAKFAALVAEAESLLGLLPWGKDFEKDAFMKPDFTSLDVLAFAGAGVPGGINIPNYDAVRQADGFKNVSLGNVLGARDYSERSTFLADADQALYAALAGPAFEVQVGLHELLGHGSGKVFTEGEGGALNFDVASVVDPFAPCPGRVRSWYKPGQSWDTVFGALASTMEECRAEAVGIYLCVLPRVLQIFGHGGGSGSDGGAAAAAALVDGIPAPAAGGDLVYVNWLSMARAGLLALQYYNPATRAWGQAHMQARYGLLRVMLEAGGGLLTIAGLDDAAGAAGAAAPPTEEGQAGVHVALDRAKIASIGVPAVGAFLRRLQVYKSTADAGPALAWYAALTAVPDAWLPLRALVVARRKPRQMLVQPVIEPLGTACALAGGGGGSVVTTGGAHQRDLQLRAFPATAAGLVDSFAHRYAGAGIDADLLALWRDERGAHALGGAE